MSNEVLEMIRESYNSLLVKKNKEKEDLKRLEQLEKNDIVREYLNLKNSLLMPNNQYRMLSDDELIEAAFQGYKNCIVETNCIYVCLGEFAFGREKKLYKRYMNIEKSDDAVLIPLEECLEFEKNHEVVFVSGIDDGFKHIFDNRYEEVQRDFLREAINGNQEKACHRVLSKKY